MCALKVSALNIRLFRNIANLNSRVLTKKHHAIYFHKQQFEFHYGIMLVKEISVFSLIRSNQPQANCKLFFQALLFFSFFLFFLFFSFFLFFFFIFLLNPGSVKRTYLVLLTTNYHLETFVK